MNIIPIEDANSNFELVYINNGTPHCQKHGAMNKVNLFNGGSYWRCICSVPKKADNNCRAGCIQIN